MKKKIREYYTLDYSKKSFFSSKKTPYIYSMNKQKQLEVIKDILEVKGILEGQDYIFSLQGPTVITTMQGAPKITPEIREALEILRVDIL